MQNINKNITNPTHAITCSECNASLGPRSTIFRHLKLTETQIADIHIYYTQTFKTVPNRWIRPSLAPSIYRLGTKAIRQMCDRFTIKLLTSVDIRFNQSETLKDSSNGQTDVLSEFIQNELAHNTMYANIWNNSSLVGLYSDWVFANNSIKTKFQMNQTDDSQAESERLNDQPAMCFLSS